LVFVATNIETDKDTFLSVFPSNYSIRIILQEKYKMPARLKYGDVYNYFQENGYELLDKEYKNWGQKLTLKDEEGYFYYLTLSQFKSAISEGYEFGKFHPFNVYAKQNIQKYFDDIDSGYVLLDFHLIGKESYVVIQDGDGYKYDARLQNILRGDQGLRTVDVRNRFSLENIPVWLRLNNKTFYLTEDNLEYKGKDQKLDFHCTICTENFETSWHCLLNGTNCTCCSGRSVGKYNNLAYRRPDLAEEWDYKKNKFSPDEVTEFSNKSASWICSECNHRWTTESISERSGQGHGCPSCSGRAVTDKNRLSIVCPDVAAQWHPTKNGDLTPYDVAVSSNKKVWWLCKNGHEWFVAPNGRTYGENGCRKCSSSKGEKIIYDWLNFNFKKLRRFGVFEIKTQVRFDDCRNKKPLPFDFGINFVNREWLLIEYHGIQHFEITEFFGGRKALKDVQKHDKIKEKYCRKNKISLLMIPYWEKNNIEQILTETLL
jgi:hypothetical protein